MARPAEVVEINIRLETEIAIIRASGLFDAGFYQGRIKDLGGLDPIQHFCTEGRTLLAWPNPYFDPAFYLNRNPDVAGVDVNPLLHYITHGDGEGRDPSPFFRVAWYRAQYAISANENALAHFLARRATGQVSPVPVFDAGFYLDTNPDVAAAGADPFEHFLAFGVAEGRDPAPGFDIAWFVERHKKAIGTDHPFLFYLRQDNREALPTARPRTELLSAGAVRDATRPARSFEEVRPVPAQAARRARLLAYYLPQFHPIAENDAWWGKGFTDWTNLARSVPRFAGHVQPRVPRDLGFYSLEDPSVMPKQIALAKGAGIDGFVFYYYWFDGKRLLERPVERFLADPSLDINFALMWANENWTRRWDGLEREVLISQGYRERDDAPLVADFVRHFRDPRYIRIDGRPLLMIYRVGLIPDAEATIARWRRLFRENHGEDPILAMAQTFDDVDPQKYGLDGAIEFPPHKLVRAAEKINAEVEKLDPEFSADVYRYEDIAQASLAAPTPPYPLIKTVVPGWDNDPRREGRGMLLHGATPGKYQAWLERTVALARRHPFLGEPVVCINAWNEWAEGAFLEPDIHFGGAFLNATGRAVCGIAPADAATRILLVGHDALPHGAQMLLLHLARYYRRACGLEVHVLLLGTGALLDAYKEVAHVATAPDDPSIAAIIDGHAQRGIRAAIVNTSAAARTMRFLREHGIATTLLIHELPRLLREKSLAGHAKRGALAAERIVFSTETVRDRFAEALELNLNHALILPQGNYRDVGFDADARKRLRAAHGIPEKTFLILGVGFADMRKGFDLFLQAWRALTAQRADVHFAWVGDVHIPMRDYLDPEIEAAKASGSFHHIGFTDDINGWFSAGDVYALTSREDPFPTVVIEALAAGRPAVVFEGSGGMPDFIRAHADIGAGRIAAQGDVGDFVRQLTALLDRAAPGRAAPALAALIAGQFAFPDYADRLLRETMPYLRGVSACVVNYNHARFLPERLGSIFGQAYPLAETLFLDDASTDESIAVAETTAAEWDRTVAILANAKNENRLLAQWRRAAERARGDYVWIAEADDAAEPEFLARLVDALTLADNPLMAFADSRAVDGAGKTVMPSYQRYYIDSGAAALAVSGVWPGGDFAREFLAERNLILNMSAVIFRRAPLLAALDRLAPEADRWKLAADWRLYLELLAGQKGEVVYVAEPLNRHRRHDDGVTARLDPSAHVAEIAAAQAIAAERLGLGADGRARQAAYAEAIAKQLGATPRAAKPAAKGKAKGRAS